MTMQPTASTVYDAAQFDCNFPAGIEDHYWFLARTRVLHRTLERAVRRGAISPRASILEVGCGTGVVVAGLRNLGYDIRGVELGRPPRLVAADLIHTGVRAQDLDQDFRSRVDALMFLDVIEHVPHDVSFLEETLSAFPQCRAVFVTVPARAELWSNHDRHYGHYRRYTRRSLSQTLQAAGLEVAQARYFFRSLYVAAGLIKICGRERDPVMTAPTSTTIHRALAAILSAEDRLLSALPLPGLSVLGVGTRQLSNP